MTPETRAIIRGHAMCLCGTIQYLLRRREDEPQFTIGWNLKATIDELIRPYSLEWYRKADFHTYSPSAYEIIRTAIEGKQTELL